jgi:hypothetical protein
MERLCKPAEQTARVRGFFDRRVYKFLDQEFRYGGKSDICRRMKGVFKVSRDSSIV